VWIQASQEMFELRPTQRKQFDKQLPTALEKASENQAG